MIYASAQRGDDTNAGTFAAPLREISKAIERVSAGETIVVLDSGDYAPFTVDKSLEIEAHDAQAKIRPGASPFPAIRVGAGSADVVSLRGLTMTDPDGRVGVSFESGRALHVERCAISGFDAGIRVEQGILYVEDTRLLETGIEHVGGRAVIDGCSIRGSGASVHGTGLLISGSARMTVMRSLISDHSSGIYLRGAPGSAAPLLSLTDSVITHNRHGIYADRTGQVQLSRTTVTLNDIGLFTLNNGVIYTVGNNAVLGNLDQNIGPGAIVRFFHSDVTG
jgi:Right handed beta helix region